jgi:WD40 repeat protein
MYHPIDNTISVGLSNGTINILERYSGLIIDSFKAHEKDVNFLLSSDKNCFYSCGSDRVVSCWDSGYIPSIKQHSFILPNLNIINNIVSEQNVFCGFHVDNENQSIFAATPNSICYATIPNFKLNKIKKTNFEIYKLKKVCHYTDILKFKITDIKYLNLSQKVFLS